MQIMHLCTESGEYGDRQAKGTRIKTILKTIILSRDRKETWNNSFLMKKSLGISTQNSEGKQRDRYG